MILKTLFPVILADNWVGGKLINLPPTRLIDDKTRLVKD
jgi:hypothetical protein